MHFIMFVCSRSYSGSSGSLGALQGAERKGFAPRPSYPSPSISYIPIFNICIYIYIFLFIFIYIERDYRI